MLAHESSAALAVGVEAASAPAAIAATASAAKTVDSAARTVALPILATRGVTVLMIWFPFPFTSMFGWAALPGTSGRLDLRFRETR